MAGQDSSSVPHTHFGVATCTEGRCGRQASLKSHQVMLVGSHVLEPQGWTVGTLQTLCIPRALCSPRSWSRLWRLSVRGQGACRLGVWWHLLSGWWKDVSLSGPPMLEGSRGLSGDLLYVAPNPSIHGALPSRSAHLPETLPPHASPSASVEQRQKRRGREGMGESCLSSALGVLYVTPSYPARLSSFLYNGHGRPGEYGQWGADLCWRQSRKRTTCWV